MKMVCLFKINNKYYVAKDMGDDLADYEIIDWIDELIAEPVVRLCNKGYLTTYSCSGHAYKSCEYDVIEPGDEIQYSNEYNYIGNVFDEDNNCIYLKLREKYEDQIYIAFKEDYKFKNLPENWYYDTALRCDIKAQNHIDFYKLLLKNIDSILKWIDNLK